MALTPEQVVELKKQLSEQIQQLPEEQRATAQQQIDSMSPDALELMLKQQQEQAQKQKIFRMIMYGEIPSKKIAENQDCIAVLDTKPISKGHTIIIPKNAVTNSKDLPSSTFELAKEISAIICEKLKSHGTEIQTQFSFGELIINIIPVYDQPVSINSPRSEAKSEELHELQKLLKIEPKPIQLKSKTPLPPTENKNTETTSKEKEKIIKLKRRIP